MSSPLPAAIAYLAVLLLTLVAMMMGLIIVFQAYRGYRRNKSDPMLYLALGLVFVTIAPFLLSLIFTISSEFISLGSFAFAYTLPILSRCAEVIGLSCILYSLYMR